MWKESWTEQWIFSTIPNRDSLVCDFEGTSVCFPLANLRHQTRKIYHPIYRYIYPSDLPENFHFNNKTVIFDDLPQLPIFTGNGYQIIKRNIIDVLTLQHNTLLLSVSVGSVFRIAFL